jgi:hypothetical protein
VLWLKLPIFNAKLRIDFIKLTIIIAELHIFDVCKVIYRRGEVSKLILFVVKLPTADIILHIHFLKLPSLFLKYS